MAVDLFIPELGDGPFPVLVYAHGFKGFKDWGYVPHLHEFFEAHNTAVVTFNHTHNGVHSRDFDDLERFARNTITQELRDLESLGKWLKQECDTYNLNADSLNWLGHSRGGANVIVFASLFPDFVRKAITWAPLGDYRHLFRQMDLHAWKETGRCFIANQRTGQEMPLDYVIWEDLEAHEDYSVQAAARALGRPLLILHGDQDQAVPLEQGQALHQACLHSLMQVMEGADHTFGCSHPCAGPEDFSEALWLTMDATQSFLEEDM
ncbi:MAG: alpha/beta hydrolase family protein [Bacteroidia bacterium]